MAPIPSGMRMALLTEASKNATLPPPGDADSLHDVRLRYGAPERVTHDAAEDCWHYAEADIRLVMCFFGDLLSRWNYSAGDARVTVYAAEY